MSGPRHTYADLAALADELAPDVSLESTAGGEPVQLNGGVPAERVAELVETMRTRAPAAWRDPGDQSEYDWSLTNEAIGAGFTDDEIHAVLVENRLLHDPDDRKAEREDYFARTIAKARAKTDAAHGDQPRPATASGTASENGSGPSPADDGEASWLDGTPMDPTATPAEPLPTLSGFPFLNAGSGAVIVGPTGGGRSALIQACMYDAAKDGLRCAYLGHEVTESEFNARAAVLAQLRGDDVDDELRSSLARVRYLNLESVISKAWADPPAWVQGIAGTYDLLAIDPLSAVASALDFAFDKSNDEYVRFYDQLVQPLTRRGVAVVAVDNIGHAEDAKRRAKGASAKSDRADLTFSCAPSANPVGLRITAQKVRSIRAPHRRGDEWVFVKDSQRIEQRDRGGDAPNTFRPTNIMQKVSYAVEQTGGLSKTQIRTAVGRKNEHVDLSLGVLIAEGYIEVQKDGQTHTHKSAKPYREADDPATESTESQLSPNPVPDSVPDTKSHQVPPPVGGGTGDWTGCRGTRSRPGLGPRCRCWADDLRGGVLDGRSSPSLTCSA